MEHKVIASVIVKVEAPNKVDSTQLGSRDNESSTLQLINGISNDLQKLRKYFIGTTMLTLFQFVLRLDLYSYYSELFGIWLLSTIKSTSYSISSLLNCHKLPEISE